MGREGRIRLSSIEETPPFFSMLNNFLASKAEMESTSTRMKIRGTEELDLAMRTGGEEISSQRNKEDFEILGGLWDMGLLQFGCVWHFLGFIYIERDVR